MQLDRQTLSGVESFVLRALDRPARSALELSGRPPWLTLAPALAGLALVALSCAFCEALVPAHSRLLGRLDVLRAALEALAVVAPSAVVLTTLLGLRAPPRLLIASFALALFTAGVVAACLAPLAAFLAVVSSSAPEVTLVPVLLLPGVTLAVHGAVTVRVLDALDGSPLARGFGRAQAMLLFAVFFALLRVLP